MEGHYVVGNDHRLVVPIKKTKFNEDVNLFIFDDGPKGRDKEGSIQYNKDAW